MSNYEKPHKNNAPGPFYVCDGCCTACELPFTEAPELFEFDSDNHCYVKRQPETNDELNRILRALYGAELECIRYRGNDPEVLRRLAESGQAHLSDIPVSGIKPVLRNHVTFDAAEPSDRLLSPQQLAVFFQEYLRSFDNEYSTHKFTRLIADPKRASFSYSWFEDNFHPVSFHSIDLPDCQWLITHSPIEETGSRSVSFQLDDWLKAENRFWNVRWYTEKQWKTSKEWQDIPW